MVMIATSYASAWLPGGAPVWGAWLMAIGSSASLVAMMMLGVARGDRGAGRLGWAFAFTFVVLAGGFGIALSMPGVDTPDGPLWLGLPPRAAIILYGIGLLPLFVLPVTYALSFDDRTLSVDDLERIRAVRRAALETRVEVPHDAGIPPEPDARARSHV